MVFKFMENGLTISTKSNETDHLNTGRDVSEESSTKASTVTSGSLHFRDDQMSYVDSNHWLSILNDIKEVQEQLSLSNNNIQGNRSVDKTGSEEELDLMFSPMPSHSIREILQSLPPRTVCDSLLSHYFNSRYMVLRELRYFYTWTLYLQLAAILHPARFQKQYEEFWLDSSKTPTIWIGLLFSILSIAATLRDITTTTAQPGSSTISAEVFRLRTRQCIVLGKYSTTRAYGLETLILHLQSNFMGLVDSNINLWFLMGIIIRLAMRMGYHRDSRRHASISPFEGEMRRRIWANIYQLDILTSFQLGLPSMIPSEYCDTEVPRNLHYSDFGPDSTVLPPSRPLSDHTPVSYTIVKGKIMNVFKKIVGHTQSLSPGSLDVTMVLDMELREAYINIPADSRMKPISQSFMDTSSTIMNRCNVELLYLKAIVVLHRRYLNVDEPNSVNTKSRGACLEAALRILAIQADLHQASQLGGQLYDDRWMISSLAAHDFLLAAMVVCLELSMHIRSANAERDEDFAKQFDALQTSHIIWASASFYSREAGTAAQTLELMIQKIKDSDHVDNPSIVADLRDTTLNADESSLLYAEPMVDMLDGSENLDWVSTFSFRTFIKASLYLTFMYRRC